MLNYIYSALKAAKYLLLYISDEKYADDTAMTNNFFVCKTSD